jgi:4-hydroxybenzoate polyprenyltransferase
MGRIFLAYARLLRLSGLAGFAMAPIFGALSLIQIGVQVNILTLFILFSIGMFKAIHGCVMNDYFDIEVDKLSSDPTRRPLVTGEITKKTVIIISIITVILTFAVVFIYFYKDQPSFYYGVICIILAAAIGNIYNKYGKKFVGADFLVGFSEGIFVIAGAFLVTPDGKLSILTWIIFLLVFTQYLFMNMIIGGIKDADHDYLLKTKNFAIKTGVKITKDKKIYLPPTFITIGLIIRLFSAFLLFVPFLFFDIPYKIWEISLIAFLAITVLILTVKLFTIKTLIKRKKILGLLAIQGVLRYSFIPFLLIPIIGIVYATILIIFPLIWYSIITVFSGQDIAPNL